MATIDSTLCSTPVESTRTATWIIKNFDVLMQEPSDRALQHSTMNIQINPSHDINSDWFIECWPNHLGGRVTRLLVSLGHVSLPRCFPKPGPRVNVSVTAELLDFGGTGVPLGESTGWYEARETVLDLEVPHEKLTSAAHRY